MGAPVTVEFTSPADKNDGANVFLLSFKLNFAARAPVPLLFRLNVPSAFLAFEPTSVKLSSKSAICTVIAPVIGPAGSSSVPLALMESELDFLKFSFTASLTSPNGLGALTVTITELVAVPPLPSSMVTVALLIPATKYAWLTQGPRALGPSANSH